VGDVAWARGSYESVRGKIVCQWRRNGGKFTLAITVPANATATVHVPTTDAAGITEGEVPAKDAQGVEFLRTEAGRAVFQIGSGSYEFTSNL
jgi:alpha-L-rhamnosidase